MSRVPLNSTLNLLQDLAGCVMIKKQTKNQSIYAYHFGFIVMDRRSYWTFETSSATKSEEKRMFSQAIIITVEPREMKKHKREAGLMIYREDSS